MADADDSMERLAELFDVLAPGSGDELRGIWSSLQPMFMHQIGLALAATSGAATEYDYYTDDPPPCDCGTCTAIRGELGPDWRLS